MPTAPKIEHANVNHHPAPNNAYIAAQLKLREAIDALRDLDRRLAEDDSQKTWLDANDLTHTANELVDAINAANGHEIDA